MLVLFVSRGVLLWGSLHRAGSALLPVKLCGEATMQLWRVGHQVGKSGSENRVKIREASVKIRETGS